MQGATLAAVWPIQCLAEPEPLRGGINNRSFRVRTAAGDYILRIYPHTAPPQQIAFEMSLLNALSQVNLPFQTPVPLPAHTGELAPRLSIDDHMAQAILTAVIPGTFRQPSSPSQAYSAGAALGALTVALGSLALPQVSLGNYGDLERLLPDPLEAAKMPYADADTRRRLTRLLEEVMAERHAWYSVLPRQVIHGDYVPFNLLMVDDRVSAVLDFELACPDLRAMDFAIGFWPWLRWDGNLSWPMAEAFGKGYTAYQPLTAEEAEALPFLLRLRRAMSLVWWVARYHQGITDETGTKWTVASALDLEDWLTANRGDVTAYARKLLRK